MSGMDQSCRHSPGRLPEESVTAAGGFRRNLTDLEIASQCDFAAMDSAWRKAVASALHDWESIVADQRLQIRNQITAAVDGDPDNLAKITVDTSAAARLLEDRMIEFALAAGRQQQREAEDQGVDVPEWSLPDENVLTSAAGRRIIEAISRTTASVLGGSLVQSAKRRALALLGLGRSGSSVATEVDQQLRDLSTSFPEENIGAAMTAAQNAGRLAVLSVAPGATYIATEVMDKNSCAPCRQIDGTTYTSLVKAEADYPSGGYQNCLGFSRCRGTLVAVWNQGETASGVTMPAEVDTAAQEETMPYRIEEKSSDCPSDMPYGVVKEGTGEVMGCHGSRASAEEQMAALYASEDGTDMADQTSTVAPWSGVLAVEGVTTGDGREFAPESITWADLPIPLRWNKEDSHGGEPHTVAVNVGRIDKIWRDGSNIMGDGVIDLSHPDGKRAYELIKGQFLRGVSIDADSIKDSDIEFVWPEGDGGATAEEDPFAQMFASPEKILFNTGRIRAATLVDIPAFAEAYIQLVGGPVTASAADQAAFGVVGSHSTATSDAAWDGPANEARLASPLTVDKARQAYAWYDSAAVSDGTLPKADARFIHHEVSADGSVGAANLAACSAGIGVLNGARGGTVIPAADKQGVYDHLARHLRDADREPPPLQMAGEVLVAHGAPGWTPDAAWFTNPKLSVPTPITITADGRVYGHAAQWGECHIGQQGVCVTPPQEDSHPYFMTGEVVCADGAPVAVGQITVGTSHAPLSMGAQPAAQHYDHTGWAVADVRVGNDEHGIWVAGAVRPGADDSRVYELRASGQVSGDWRRIGGSLRLVGLLAVNVPGFPVPKVSSRVASGVQHALVAAGQPTVSRKFSAADQDRAAMRRVMQMLRTRVHQGR